MPATLQRITDICCELLAIPATVGFERPFFQHLITRATALGCRATHWTGLLVLSGPAGDDPSLPVFAAHVDRHGLVSSGPDEFEYAAHALTLRDGKEASASLDSPGFLGEIARRFQGNRVRAYEPWTGEELVDGIIRRAGYEALRGNIVFEIENAERMPVGAPLAYDTPVVVGKDRLSGQIDNAIGVALALALLESGFPGTILFTAEEEAGRSWRFLRFWCDRLPSPPRRLIVLDTSPYPDEASVTAQDVVLRRRDQHAPYQPAIAAELEAACRQLGLSYGFKDDWIDAWNRDAAARQANPRGYGTTELGRLITASEGRYTGGSIQVPTIGYHTAFETARFSAIESCFRLACHISGL